MGDYKDPCDQGIIATMASPPLEPAQIICQHVRSDLLRLQRLILFTIAKPLKTKSTYKQWSLSKYAASVIAPVSAPAP
jgi:hypothetical protein